MKRRYNSTLSAAEAKSHDGTNNSVRRKWSALALAGFLFTSIFALSPSPVGAECPQGWDVSGQWVFKQSNQGAPNQMDLRQNGTVVTGKAWFEINQAPSGGFLGIGKKYGATGTVSGPVEGTMTGENFSVKIFWDNQNVGVYNGKIGPRGQLTGTGYEIKSPSRTVSWFSDSSMKCAQANAVDQTAPAPPRPPPIKKSGHMPKATPSPTPPGHKPKKS